MANPKRRGARRRMPSTARTHSTPPELDVGRLIGYTPTRFPHGYLQTALGLTTAPTQVAAWVGVSLQYQEFQVWVPLFSLPNRTCPCSIREVQGRPSQQLFVRDRKDGSWLTIIMPSMGGFCKSVITRTGEV